MRWVQTETLWNFSPFEPVGCWLVARVFEAWRFSSHRLMPFFFLQHLSKMVDGHTWGAFCKSSWCRDFPSAPKFCQVLEMIVQEVVVFFFEFASTKEPFTNSDSMVQHCNCSLMFKLHQTSLFQRIIQGLIRIKISMALPSWCRCRGATNSKWPGRQLDGEPWGFWTWGGQIGSQISVMDGSINEWIPYSKLVSALQTPMRLLCAHVW